MYEDFGKNIGMYRAYVVELWGVFESLVYVKRLDFKAT